MHPESRDGTPPANGDGRSPSPGDKRPASEIADSDPEGGVSTAVGNDAGDATSTIDEQVAQVSALMMQPLKDGQKGYAISSTWLKKVFARSSTHADRADKESLESELGPVDNSDIVLDIGPKQDDLKDEQGGLYVPMRPGLQFGEDYEIVPQEGWDLIIKWYGLAKGSPVITRYAHETSAYVQSNIIWELSPPIVTIFKLSNPSAGMTPQLLKERSLPPVKALAGRSTNYMKWLKEAKQLAGIDLATKVRVWKISGGIPSANASASTTPAVSRAASPAPASAFISSAHKNLLVDLNTFLSLTEGVQRECLQHVKDQTNNPNYNGKMTLIMAGLVETEAVVLEEEIGKGEWVSEASAKTLRNLGIPTEKSKKIAPTPVKSSPAPSGRTSPVPALPRGKKSSGNRLGVTGFNNLGNTCYQNAATQCLRAVEELSIFFLNNAHSKDLNFDNPLGYRGELAKAYSGLLHGVYRDPPPSCFNPSRFRNQVGRNNPTMAGWEQQDSQEFLMFVLDGLSEDLNRILKKPYIEKPDSTDEMVHNRKALEEFARKSWDIYKARNDSVITDLFAGMYKSTLVCPECEKVSIMFDPFSSLTLPIPDQRNIIYREVIYMSLNSRPKRFLVEVDKNGTVQNFRDAVAEKRQVAPEQLIGAEVTNGVFWQILEKNAMSYMELRIKNQDVITFMELDTPPTDDRILIPVFHRKTQGINGNKGNKGRPKRDAFAYPTILSFSSEEARDLKAIYDKILKHVATMTTRDILNEKPERPNQEEQAPEDSDTVVMNEDDARSVDSKIKTSSVEGDDSIVDVSMHDASQSSSTSTDNTEYTDETPAHPLASSISQHLLDLFDVKYMTTHERIPRGRMMDPIKEHPLITSRIQSSRKDADDSDAADASETRSISDQSEISWPQDEPFIRRGEAILIDWNDEGRHALLGGNSNKRNTEQGEPTYNNPEFIPDNEIIKRRAERDAKREEGIALDECLNEFSKDEILSENDAWYCPRCKEHRQASKKFQLWSAPDILVIHLKRFMQGGSIGRTFRSKLDTLVRFPLEDLDLSEHITGPSDGKTLKYDLIGVDCHSGTMSGGHYYAYAKNWVTGDWCDFNDQHAGIIKNAEKRVTTPAAYLLFYRRQGAGPLGGPEIQKIVNAYRNGTEASNESQVEESHTQVSERESSEEPDTNPLSFFSQPSWSFNQPNDTALDNDQNDDGEDLFGDNDSNMAVEDGNSEPGDRLQELDNDGSNFEDVPALEDASDEELPVVELRVSEEDKE